MEQILRPTTFKDALSRVAATYYFDEFYLETETHGLYIVPISLDTPILNLCNVLRGPFTTMVEYVTGMGNNPGPVTGKGSVTIEDGFSRYQVNKQLLLEEFLETPNGILVDLSDPLGVLEARKRLARLEEFVLSIMKPEKISEAKEVRECIGFFKLTTPNKEGEDIWSQGIYAMCAVYSTNPWANGGILFCGLEHIPEGYNLWLPS